MRNSVIMILFSIVFRDLFEMLGYCPSNRADSQITRYE